MFRINQEQAVPFVQQALARAVPHVTFTVADARSGSGDPGLQADWTDARSGESGSSFFPLPHPERGTWDAGSLVYAAVRHFTAAFDLTAADERDRAA
jgi:hypothetical protein